MKKIFLSLLFMITLLACSCNRAPKYQKEYSPDELSLYAGYVIIGTTWSRDETKFCFIVKEDETKTQSVVEVSKQTFNMYHLGDTIPSIRIFNKEGEDINPIEETTPTITEKAVTPEYIVSKAINSESKTKQNRTSYSGVVEDDNGNKYIINVVKEYKDKNEFFITAKQINP